MRVRFFFLVPVLSTGPFAQQHLRTIRPSGPSVPAWAQPWYAEGPNGNALKAAYDAHYAGHEFEKTVHTQWCLEEPRTDGARSYRSAERVALKKATGTKYPKEGQRSIAGREQVLMQVIHAFIAVGAKFFEVPFIHFVEDELNNRPRKRFKFRLPIHTFDRLTQ